MHPMTRAASLAAFFFVPLFACQSNPRLDCNSGVACTSGTTCDTATGECVAIAPSESVSISPTMATVIVGATQQFVATVTNATNPAVTWSVVEGAAGGTISSGGLYTAVSPGTFHIVATSAMDHTVTATATATVPAITIDISPGSATIVGLSTQQYTAVVHNAVNTAVAWSVSAGAGSISTSGGLYTATNVAGTYTVTAMSLADSSVSASVLVVVTPAPTLSVSASRSAVLAGDPPVAITATVTNSSDPIHWTLNGLGALSAATGSSIAWTPPAQATSSSGATITAQLGTSTTTSSVTIAISPSNIASIAITPGVLCEDPTGSGQLSAAAVDANGVALSPTFFWSSSDTAVATVDGNGLVTAIGLGTSTVVATAGGVTSPGVVVSVLPAPTGILIYSAYDSVAATYRVHMANMDGTGGDTALAEGWGPRLSPDQTAVAYRRGGGHPSGTGDSLYVTDLNLQTELELFANNDYIVGETWTNDSERVIFDFECSMNIVDRDGGSVGNFYSTPNCYDDNPDTNSIDGRVAFQNVEFGYFINTVDSTGQNRTNIPNTGNFYDPRWSPDGGWLAADYTAGNNPGQLEKIELDGGMATPLTTFASDQYNYILGTGPWTLDGNWVVVPVQRGSSAGTTLSIQAVAADGSGCMIAIPVEFASSADSTGTIIPAP